MSIDESAEITGITDSISGTVSWLQENEPPDLIFMDIELSDGQSFEIFKLTDVKCPVVFTTSYDEYALKAFKVNSIDYLLKPIQQPELEAAIRKFKRLKEHYAVKESQPEPVNMDELVKQLQMKLQPKEYRKRFLVKLGQRLISIDIEDISYFFSDGRLNFFTTTDSKKYIVDYTMDELESMIDPKEYFRISRSFYVSANSIAKIDDYFGNRLMLTVNPVSEKEVIVSREKVSEFKKWLGK